MITHNGKQVSIAMRNRKAINLIARNGKAMFGELVDLNRAGINRAAKAVILAEYGKQVWSDVRDYAKAHPAIVEFINQDPHLAASISPNSNKERWLKGDGNAYIDTGIAPRSNHRLHIPQLYWDDDTIFTDYDRNAGLAYTDNGSTGNQGWGFNLWGDTLYVGFGNYATAGKVAKNIKYDFDLNKGAWKVTAQGGTTMQGTLSGEPTPTYNLVLFAWMRNGNIPYRSRMLADRAEMYEDDNLVRDFIPMQHPTEGAGMLDLVTATFHPNANTTGQFTIAITDKE